MKQKPEKSCAKPTTECYICHHQRHRSADQKVMMCIALGADMRLLYTIWPIEWYVCGVSLGLGFPFTKNGIASIIYNFSMYRSQWCVMRPLCCNPSFVHAFIFAGIDAVVSLALPCSDSYTCHLMCTAASRFFHSDKAINHPRNNKFNTENDILCALIGTGQNGALFFSHSHISGTLIGIFSLFLLFRFFFWMKNLVSIATGLKSIK